MPSKEPSTGASPDLLEIEQTAREFEQLASEVNRRLNAILRWFSELPAKLEVAVTSPAPGSLEVGAATLAVRRTRDGWGIFYSGPDDEREYPVDQASLTNKCLALSMIPRLLEAFHEEQRDAVDRMKQATTLFAQLPTPKGGK